MSTTIFDTNRLPVARAAAIREAQLAAHMALELTHGGIRDADLATPTHIETDHTGVVLWFATPTDLATWCAWAGEVAHRIPTHDDAVTRWSLTTDIYDVTFTLCAEVTR